MPRTRSNTPPTVADRAHSIGLPVPSASLFDLYSYGTRNPTSRLTAWSLRGAFTATDYATYLRAHAEVP